MAADPSRALLRIADILDSFTQDTPSLGVREVARKLGISSSAAGRLMQSMHELGILSQDSRTLLYSIGPHVLAWSGVYTSTLDVRVTALPMLHELHQETNETISLYILDGRDRICVERLESPMTVRFVPRLGRRIPLYAGSGGKAMLAFLPEERQREILASDMVAFTALTITDRARFMDELKLIHTQGYAVSRGEWEAAASGVGAPIFEQSGEVIAAVTISGPAQRFTDEKIGEYIPAVLRIARQISSDMGYRSSSLSKNHGEPFQILRQRG